MGTSFLLLLLSKHQQCLGKLVRRVLIQVETTILRIVMGRTPTPITRVVDKPRGVTLTMGQDTLSTGVLTKGTAETTVSTKTLVAKEAILPRILPPKNRS